MTNKARQFCASCKEVTTQTRESAKEPWKCLCCERANFSIWEAASPEELHATLTSLPLHPYMDVSVTPIMKHTTTEAWEKEHGAMPPFQ